MQFIITKPAEYRIVTATTQYQIVKVSTTNQVIAKSIVSMASELEISVVAEGVETNEASRFMRVIGCSYGQGYLFEKPKAADEMTSLLNRSH